MILHNLIIGIFVLFMPLLPVVSFKFSNAKSYVRLNAGRRLHLNKYANISKSAVWGPLLPKHEPEIISLPISISKPSTSGTTVPLLNNTINSEIIKQCLNSSTSNATHPIIEAIRANPSKDLISFDYRTIDPRDPYSFGYVSIGYVGRPHGVQGEAKIHLTTDDASIRFSPNSALFIKRPHRRSPREIRIASSRRIPGNQILVKFQGFSSRNQAALVTGCEVFARSMDRSPLKPDEYYIRDLTGCRCMDVSSARYDSSHHASSWSSSSSQPEPMAVIDGVVPPQELCSNPNRAKLMHSLLELRLFPANTAAVTPNNMNRRHRIHRKPFVEYDDTKYCLVPLVEAIVKEIDIEKKIIYIDPPKGLLLLTYCKPKPRTFIRGLLAPKAKSLTNVHMISMPASYELKNVTAAIAA